MYTNLFPWEDDDDMPFSEHTPPEDMTPDELVEHVQYYGIEKESPYMLVQETTDTLVDEDFLDEKEQIWFTCLILCKNRLEELSADFLFSEDVDVEKRQRIVEYVSRKERLGELLDIDILPWVEKLTEYEHANNILLNMMDVFESMLRDSLDRKLFCFNSQYFIINPFRVIAFESDEGVEGSGLVYYPDTKTNEIWGPEHTN